jgi:GcrA cell cycle regulator
MSFEWTPEAIEVASEMYALGHYSAADIGKMIGTTRNAVIGKLNRLKSEGEPGAVMPAKPAKPQLLEAEPRERPAPKPPVSKPPAPEPPKKLFAPREAVRPVFGPFLFKTIIELGPNECRYPKQEPSRGQHLFCAAPTGSGEVYCTACRPLCYRSAADESARREAARTYAKERAA